MSERISILIVDDHDMVREGLIAFLRAYPDLHLVGDAAGGEEALQLCRERRPDVVLMDLVMPEMDGVAAIRAIHQELPQIHIIALSSFGDERLVREALRAGATSYLLKNIPAAKLADAIRAAHAGLPTLSPEVTRELVREPTPAPRDLDSLTLREQDVLAQLVNGRSNAEIAQQLGISIYTVKNHVSSILSKFDVTSRTEAVSIALKKP